MGTPELNIRITRELEDINNRLVKEKYSVYNQVGIHAGLSGRALLMSLNYEVTKNNIFNDKLTEILDQIMDCIQAGYHTFPTLASGLAGFGWLISYLSEINIVDVDDNSDLKEIDDYISLKLDELLSEDNYDILNGGIGIGHYYLKKGNKREVIKILDYLKDKKIDVGDESYWLRALFVDDVPKIDFGLAHGNAGVLQFLIKCYENNIENELCLDLIKRSVNFFIINVQPFDIVKSNFPHSIPLDDFKSGGNSFHNSRLAWCYGDLTVWYILYQASTVLKNGHLQKQALDGLLLTISRKSQAETTVIDPGFCHGSSGLAYVYLKLWHLTKNSQFKYAAEYWLEETFKFKDTEGYKYLLGNFENREFRLSNELLEGDTGLALVFLAYLNPQLSNWDQCMLL